MKRVQSFEKWTAKRYLLIASAVSGAILHKDSLARTRPPSDMQQEDTLHSGYTEFSHIAAFEVMPGAHYVILKEFHMRRKLSPEWTITCGCVLLLRIMKEGISWFPVFETPPFNFSRRNVWVCSFIEWSKTWISYERRRWRKNFHNPTAAKKLKKKRWAWEDQELFE